MMSLSRTSVINDIFKNGSTPMGREPVSFKKWSAISQVTDVLKCDPIEMRRRVVQKVGDIKAFSDGRTMMLLQQNINFTSFGIFFQQKASLLKTLNFFSRSSICLTF